MLTLNRWKSLENNLTSENLKSLFRNEIASIRIPNFASTEECESFANQVQSFGFDFYENVFPPIGRIGITQFEHSNKNKLEYFKAAKNANETYRKISSLSFSPLCRLAEILRETISTEVNIAYENDVYGSYFAGLVRQINQALLHLDFAPLDAPGWEIEKISSQLAWNLYVKAPNSGGVCRVYNRQWQAEDELQKIPGSYKYSHNLVKDTEFKDNTPIVGDLVIFNSRNFHEVLPAQGERITVSSFIGKMPEGNLVFWS